MALQPTASRARSQFVEELCALAAAECGALGGTSLVKEPMNDRITHLFRHPWHVIKTRWHKQVRVHDFAQRTKGTLPATQIYLHPRGYGGYLPIHPFADEGDLLQHLGLTPTMCRRVDAYWHYGDDVFFLEVGVMADDLLLRQGVFARTVKDQQLNILAFVKAEAIYRDLFETVMEMCVRCGVTEPQAIVRLTHEWCPLCEYAYTDAV